MTSVKFEVNSERIQCLPNGIGLIFQKEKEFHF